VFGGGGDAGLLFSAPCLYEFVVPGRIYRVDLVTIDAHTRRQLERRVDNEMLEMDFTDSWEGVCNAKSG
jgi:hypothetical protein